MELPLIAAEHGRISFREGWLDQTSSLLADKTDVELHVLSGSEEEYYELNTGNIWFSSYTEGNIREQLIHLINKVNPDIYHIWGTEFKHCYDAVELLGTQGLTDRIVISVQGLVSECVSGFVEGLPDWLLKKRTAYEFIKRNGMADGAETFKKRGEYEKAAIRSVKHVIGRTEWDKQKVREINPGVVYHKCNEILRRPFYDREWSAGGCRKYRIMFSQAHYPLKGFHYMIPALDMIKKRFPEAGITVAGESPYESRGLTGRIKESSYQKYIKDLTDKYGLKENIMWTGCLNAEQMAEMYLTSNVFVCASNIENSSNSVCEAMLLGVPVVASDVGGMKSLLKDGREGYLFKKGDIGSLAGKIEDLFENPGKAEKLGANARIRALKTHDRNVNTENLINIYRQIIF